MKIYQRILTASALAVLGTGLASAGTLVTPCTVAMGSTELGVGGASSGTVSCPGDSGLSGVTGITITITGSVISPSSIQLHNTNGAPQSGSATTNVQFSIDASSSLPGTSLSGNLFSVSAGTGAQTLAGGATATIPVTGSSNSGAVAVASANFSHYTSAFSFIADTVTGLTSTFGGGNVSILQATTASATASVTYTYGTVPEPTSVLLFGTALCLAAFGLKRRLV